MDRKKTLLMFLGVISGMVFVWGLDILTARLPADLKHDFMHWKVLSYDVKAQIDTLRVVQKERGRVPVRYVYSEDMELNFYHYHTPRAGRRTVMMELVTKKLTPKSITVGGSDATGQLGPGFAADVPPPWYVFFDFEEYGAIEGQRRAAGVRDMIVSTYYVRRLPRKTVLTRDTWSGEVDMGPFITTYNWRFDRLEVAEEGKLADISGEGEFFEELPGGGRGKQIGSYGYSYNLGIARNKHYAKKAEGLFDLSPREADAGTSYREEFTQLLTSVRPIPSGAQMELAVQLEALRGVVELRELGDARAFHGGLLAYLRTYDGSPFWDKLFAVLNALRVDCKEEPLTKDDILGGQQQDNK